MNGNTPSSRKAPPSTLPPTLTRASWITMSCMQLADPGGAQLCEQAPPPTLLPTLTRASWITMSCRSRILAGPTLHTMPHTHPGQLDRHVLQIPDPCGAQLGDQVRVVGQHAGDGVLQRRGGVGGVALKQGMHFPAVFSQGCAGWGEGGALDSSTDGWRSASHI